MSGDYTACQFLSVSRLRGHRCRIRFYPETLETKSTLCFGLPKHCECRGLREREIRRLAIENNLAEKEAATRARSAREWARRRLDRLTTRFGGVA